MALRRFHRPRWAKANAASTELIRLAELLEKGLITRSEFEAAKSRLLG
jgi:hypothetical protein